MTTTTTDVATIPVIGHDEAMLLAGTEFTRTVSLLRQLRGDQWHEPTVCQPWDVRALVAHMLGMAEAQASIRQFARDFRAARNRTGGLMIDAMTAAQVRDRAGFTPAQLTDRLAKAAPQAVRSRRRTPAPARWAIRMRQDPPFDTRRWKYGYLVDITFTRDTWMHRLELDALEFSWILAGRAPGAGLLATRVPF